MRMGTDRRFAALLALTLLSGPFAGLGPYRKGWERMDAALKKRIEASGSGPEPTGAPVPR